MGQSKKMSLVESVVSTAVGFCLSWFVWVWVAGPLFGWEVTVASAFNVTLLFTFLSIVRQYVLRRIFNFIGKY